MVLTVCGKEVSTGRVSVDVRTKEAQNSDYFLENRFHQFKKTGETWRGLPSPTEWLQGPWVRRID